MGPKQITTDAPPELLFGLLQEFLRKPYDVFLLLVFLANALLYGIFFWQFDSLTWAARSAMGFVLTLLICTNYQCVSHNFIHHPFFVNDGLNTLFSLLNSPLLGMPQFMYTVHHLHHHRYNMDHRDPTNIYRYSRYPNRPENLLSYCILGVLRTDVVEMYKFQYPNSPPKWAKNLEVVLCLVPFPLAFLMGGTSLLVAYTVIWYSGQAMALAENYLEHYGATPGNRQMDAVSCYNPIYNFLWFNNGYHQEHHYKPMVHWTQIKNVRNQLPLPAHKHGGSSPSRRRVVPLAHFTNIVFPIPPAVENSPKDS
jgi:fatty acid desaturase